MAEVYSQDPRYNPFGQYTQIRPADPRYTPQQTVAFHTGQAARIIGGGFLLKKAHQLGKHLSASLINAAHDRWHHQNQGPLDHKQKVAHSYLHRHRPRMVRYRNQGANRRMYARPRYKSWRPRANFTRAFRPGRHRTGGYNKYAKPNLALTEQKFFDTDLSFNMGTAATEEPSLNLVPQGVTEKTRIGRKLHISSLFLRGRFFNDPVATNVPSLCTLVLALDKQCNGAAATWADIYDKTKTSQRVRNLANAERFTIIKTWDCLLPLTAGVDGAYVSTACPLEWYKKVKIPILFSSTTGAITEICCNNLVLLAGDSLSVDKATFEGTFRIRYSD